MDTETVMANMQRCRELLADCGTKAVARHLFRCDGTVTQVTAREVVIAWEACADCGPARSHTWLAPKAA